MDQRRRAVKPTTFRSNKMCRDLSEILREDALPYLPAKSLLRFRSVCRDWKLRISAPFFIHSQSNSCRAALGLFHQGNDGPPSFVSMDPNSCGVPDPSLSFLPESVDIKSSTSGLIVCQGQTGDKAYYICNPVLKQWKKLPKQNADHGPNPAVVLAFEPSLLNFEADYKIICAFPSNDFDDATEFEIYSSKEGTWKNSAEIRFDTSNLKSGTFSNGIVYWKAGHNLLAYDIATDRAHVVSYFNQGTIGVINGKLFSASCKSLTVSLFVMEDESSFNLKMTGMHMATGYSKLWLEKERLTLDKCVLNVANVDVIAVTSHFVVVKSGGTLYSYNMKTRETEEMTQIVGHNSMIWLPYVNTFASLEFQ